jgi:carboxypeptidase C (cathepsin A)
MKKIEINWALYSSPTGESYAGIYVPTLAEAIMHATDKGTYTGAPLKGIAVGNGCTGSELGICGFSNQGIYYEFKYLLGQAFISNDLKNVSAIFFHF